MVKTKSEHIKYILIWKWRDDKRKYFRHYDTKREVNGMIKYLNDPIGKLHHHKAKITIKKFDTVEQKYKIIN